MRTNAAAPTFFSLFVDLESWPRQRNLLELMFDPKGLRPFVENWNEFAAGLLLRVRREAVGQVYDNRLKDLLHKLRSYPGSRGTGAVGTVGKSNRPRHLPQRRSTSRIFFADHDW